jgi:hypothetical protein
MPSQSGLKDGRQDMVLELETHIMGLTLQGLHDDLSASLASQLGELKVLHSCEGVLSELATPTVKDDPNQRTKKVSHPAR